MGIKSSKRRKQRKYLFNAPLHVKRKQLSSHLSEELRNKYNTRSITVRKGDTVKVARGGLKGHVGKISEIHTRKMMVAIEKAALTKADGKSIPKLIHPSNLVIIKLDISDPKRRDKLQRNMREGE